MWSPRLDLKTTFVALKPDLGLTIKMCPGFRSLSRMSQDFIVRVPLSDYLINPILDPTVCQADQNWPQIVQVYCHIIINKPLDRLQAFQLFTNYLTEKSCVNNNLGFFYQNKNLALELGGKKYITFWKYKLVL
jgi:hypothetical protein